MHPSVQERRVPNVDVDIRPCASADEVKRAVVPITNYFGRSAPNGELAERLIRVLPAERVYAAWEGGRVVGGLGSFPFQLTVPGGRVPAAGVTIAGVCCRPTGDGVSCGQ
jgi:hypothetical protein